MKRLVLAVVSASMFVACGPPPRVYWREMLGKAIYDFAEPLPAGSASKTWIHNQDDKECDGGKPKGVEFVTSDKGLALPALPALPFGGGASGGSKFDGLAYEVFANYLTQKRKGRVIEAHDHNYWTELNPMTHRQITVISPENKAQATFDSPEDLCLLDEAKKRHAEKLLTYQILEMKNDELLIHLRYSDTKTGLVEISRTLKVIGMSISDVSF